MLRDAPYWPIGVGAAMAGSEGKEGLVAPRSGLGTADALVGRGASSRFSGRIRKGHTKLAMFTSLSVRIALLGSLALTACGAGSAKQTAKAPRAVQETAPSPTPPSGSDADGRAQVAISEDIRRICDLSAAETFFEYDSSRVSSEGNRILAKLAACFETGPLAGRTMHLVGHADPRGDEEYNYALGGRRADSVESALRTQGLRQGRVTTTSRGEIEALGTNEATWTRDRRVDVLLGS